MCKHPSDVYRRYNYCCYCNIYNYIAFYVAKSMIKELSRKGKLPGQH